MVMRGQRTQSGKLPKEQEYRNQYSMRLVCDCSAGSQNSASATLMTKADEELLANASTNDFASLFFNPLQSLQNITAAQ